MGWISIGELHFWRQIISQDGLMGLSREYPVAEDRGGIPEDFSNYSTFLERLRIRLNSSGRRFELSITLVSSKQCHRVGS